MTGKTEVPAERAESMDAALAVRERFADMARIVPEAEGDGGMSIVEAVLEAADLSALDAAWNGRGSDTLVNIPMTINEIRRSTSDYADGLGVFLVVRAVRLDTGEPLTFTTGSVSIVAQLVKAHISGWLPFNAVIVKAAKPSSNGYFPLHLEVFDPTRHGGVR